jgi:hypothetical protein
MTHPREIDRSLIFLGVYLGGDRETQHHHSRGSDVDRWVDERLHIRKALQWRQVLLAVDEYGASSRD